VEEFTARIDVIFAMVSYLSTNTVSGVGWYVDGGATRHMTTNKSTFFRLETRCRHASEAR
jgi:hypothetical protein